MTNRPLTVRMSTEDMTNLHAFAKAAAPIGHRHMTTTLSDTVRAALKIAAASVRDPAVERRD